MGNSTNVYSILKLKYKLIACKLKLQFRHFCVSFNLFSILYNLINIIFQVLTLFTEILPQNVTTLKYKTWLLLLSNKINNNKHVFTMTSNEAKVYNSNFDHKLQFSNKVIKGHVFLYNCCLNKYTPHFA